MDIHDSLFFPETTTIHAKCTQHNKTNDAKNDDIPNLGPEVLWITCDIGVCMAVYPVLIAV